MRHRRSFQKQLFLAQVDSPHNMNLKESRRKLAVKAEEEEV
jgi:hypothetical protein